MNKGSDIHPSEEWEIVVAKSFEEIEAIRPIWEQMQRDEPHPVPNADIDRYLSVVKARSDSKRPHVMLFEYNGSPSAMIVGWVGKHQLELTLGYKALLKLKLRCFTVVYGGVLGIPAIQEYALIIHHLIEALNKIKKSVTFQAKTGTVI